MQSTLQLLEAKLASIPELETLAPSAAPGATSTAPGATSTAPPAPGAPAAPGAPPAPPAQSVSAKEPAPLSEPGIYLCFTEFISVGEVIIWQILR